MANQRISEETRARIDSLWPTILDAIAAGAEIRKTLAVYDVSPDMARAYMANGPELRAQWDSAKEDSADAYFDKVVDLSNNPGADPHRARLQADLWRWLAGKRNPRTYSDKQSIDLNVRTIDVTQTLIAAQARLEAARALLPAIIGQATRVDEERG